MNEKILRNFILVLAGLALLTPFLISPTTLYPFVLAKSLALRLIICLMLCSFLFFFFKNPQYYWQILKKNWIFWGGLSFLAVITVSSLFGVDFYASFWSGAERMAGIISYLFAYLYAIILIAIQPKKEDWEKLINCHFVVAVLVSLSAILGYKYGFILSSFKGQRLTGVSGNPAFYGTYLVFTVFLALAMTMRYLNKDKNKFWFYLTSALVFTGCLFGTGTRGDMVGWGVGLLCFLFYIAIAKRKEKIGKLSITVLLIGFLCLSLIFSLKNTSLVKRSIGLSRLVSIVNFKTDITAQSRIWSYRAAIRAWRVKPIFGWGLENYKWAFVKYFIPEMVNNNPNDVTFDKVHCMPLEILATTGILGFLAYLFMFGCILKTAYDISKRNENGLSFILLGSGIIAYFVSLCFLFDTFESFLLLGFFMAIIGSQANGVETRRYNNNTRSNVVAWVGTGLIFCFVIFGILGPWQTASLYGFINSKFEAKKPADGIPYLQQAIGRHDFTSRYGLMAISEALTETSATLNEADRQTIYSLLVKGISDEIMRHPAFLDLKTREISLDLYGLSTPTKAMKEDAEKLNNELVAYAPDYLPYRPSQAFLYGLNGNFDKSLEVSNFILSKTSKLPQAFWYKGIVLYQKGQKQEALDNYLLAIKNGYSISSSDLQTLKTLAQINNRSDILNYIKANYTNP